MKPIQISTNNVPIQLYLSDTSLLKDNSLNLLKTYAEMDEIHGQVIGLPDISHKLARFSPTGMVVAAKNHIIPAATSLATNSGIRVISCDMSIKELSSTQIDILFRILKRSIPIYGLKSNNPIKPTISHKDLFSIFGDAYEWIERRYDINGEESVYIQNVNNMKLVPEKLVYPIEDYFPSGLINEGIYGLGVLESGNHFIELQRVDSIRDKVIADKLGLEKDQLLFMIHDASPCGMINQYYTPRWNYYGQEFIDFETDKGMFHSRAFADKEQRIFRDNYFPPSSPYFAIEADSKEGLRYRVALKGAMNYGIANRTVMHQAIDDALNMVLETKDFKTRLITDTMHDTITRENINGESLWVHRHGATQALPIEECQNQGVFAEIGQCFGLPGAPGCPSYICVSGKNTVSTYHSANHGAGRSIDRPDAIGMFSKKKIYQHFTENNISIYKEGNMDIRGESPEAFKDIDQVADDSQKMGLIKQIARVIPIAVKKG